MICDITRIGNVNGIVTNTANNISNTTTIDINGVTIILPIDVSNCSRIDGNNISIITALNISKVMTNIHGIYCSTTLQSFKVSKAKVVATNACSRKVSFAISCCCPSIGFIGSSYGINARRTRDTDSRGEITGISKDKTSKR